ncbi:MAG TPA: mechanosensitive ion channel domain-containing protein [Stellaceae bacterium]|nr:mechanosensitive ion channel domain-containing protein [Stellaceae bacterium]
MKRRSRGIGGIFLAYTVPRLSLIAIAILAAVAFAPRVLAADTPMDSMEGGWSERVMAQLEAEAMTDIAAAPGIPEAIGREWRSFDRQGSAGGALVDIGWIAVVTFLAIGAERLVARASSRGRRATLRTREGGATLTDLLLLLVFDAIGLAAFIGVFWLLQRHVLLRVTDVSLALTIFATNIVVRWRIVALVFGVVLRPGEPLARLIDLPDGEAQRLMRFLSVAVLAVIILVGFGRYGLLTEGNAAAHVMGLLVAVLVCGLYVMIIVRSRLAVEALIRGGADRGVISAIRQAIARAWLPIGLIGVAALFVVFIAGLSLGLLGYYRAVSSTLAILFVVLVLERLTEHGRSDAMLVCAPAERIARLTGQAFHRLLLAFFLLGGIVMIAEVWIDAIGMTQETALHANRSAFAAASTLFVAYLIWTACRLMIDRQLDAAGGPAVPGEDDDTGAPASRLQTILPLLRAAFATAIAVLAVLITLSRLGIDTAPLIAGASIFGLAVSFGSQALVRDIISGVFYMWDDAFRVGEYIDTGRLKGTVEALGIRSVRLRHQNGPLHTIPYGQLGAVTNLSRDFATIKFNLRFVPDTDIELVRRTTKQIGLAMQEDSPELAAEIMAPLKLQGVAEVVDNAVVLRFKFTARPIKPSWVQREYLKRMVKVFAEKGIRFAVSATMLLQGMPPAAEPPRAAAPKSAEAPEAGAGDQAKPAEAAAAAAAATLVIAAAAGD